MKKIINHFVITATMKCGEVCETIRHTQEGMGKVVSDLLNDEDVVRLTVVEVV